MDLEEREVLGRVEGRRNRWSVIHARKKWGPRPSSIYPSTQSEADKTLTTRSRPVKAT